MRALFALLFVLLSAPAFAQTLPDFCAGSPGDFVDFTVSLNPAVK